MFWSKPSLRFSASPPSGRRQCSNQGMDFQVKSKFTFQLKHLCCETQGKCFPL